MKILILRGVSGSGKSTYAHTLRDQKWMWVNRDSLRAAVGGSEENFDNEGLVTKLQFAAIEYAVDNDINCVVDNTNIRWHYVREIAKRYESLPGVEVELKVFDISLAMSLAQNKARGLAGGRAVPEDIIRNQYEMFQHSKDWTL